MTTLEFIEANKDRVALVPINRLKAILPKKKQRKRDKASLHACIELYGTYIKSRSRVLKHIFTRHMVANYLYTIAEFTIMEIGYILSKDHSTIINSIKTHNNMMFTDEDYRNDYKNMVDEIEKFKANSRK